MFSVVVSVEPHPWLQFERESGDYIGRLWRWRPPEFNDRLSLCPRFNRSLGPDDAELDRLCRQLADGAGQVDLSGRWPAEQLRWLGEAGVYRWFMPRDCGGFEWTEVDLVRGYMRLAAACLTTTFTLTQRSAAVRRIVECDNQAAKETLLSGLADGSRFSTVAFRT